MKAYQAAGLDVEVFAVGPNAKATQYEYDGVTVRIGDVPDYAEHLRRNDFARILVHFAHPYMIEPIREVRPKTPIIVWVHGFESEAWHRRWFNLVDDPAAIRRTLHDREHRFAKQLAFLNWLFTTDELDVTVVQVSAWFRDHVSEPDVGARARKSVVIPNVIDTDLFPHHPKDASQRHRLLAIRPYASYKYANDLTVAAILELSKRDFFDELEIDLYGDGPLRERIQAPLATFDNVHIHPHFLPQSEIPAVHRNHGVFLTPTRFDSQGVSMCEAMSSGLVPIATNIAAIPEYVTHEETGLLGGPESATDIADAVEYLHRNPERFTQLSAAAAESIRRQCGPQATIDAELELITA